MSRLARATVDLAALRHNLSLARASAPGSRVFAVLKADAYGHGLLKSAAALAAADGFAVSCLEEALPLREAGHRQRLLLLEGFFDAAEIAVLARERLDAVIHSNWQIELLERAVVSAPIDIWIKVDSGMHRLGFPPDRVAAVRERLVASSNVRAVNFMTHLASADDRRAGRTRDQGHVFAEATAGMPGERSLANSAATFGWPEVHADWVRPGIALYGCSPFIDGGDRPGLRPAMTLQARVIAVNDVAAGEAIGYGSGFVCPRRMRVGVISIGYGDGYPRHAPSGTPVLVGGRRAALAGRVSMDMCTVDLTDCPGAGVGDTVVLWGDGLPIELVADHCGTIGYELLCKVTRRVAYRYRDEDAGGEDQ